MRTPTFPLTSLQRTYLRCRPACKPLQAPELVEAGGRMQFALAAGWMDYNSIRRAMTAPNAPDHIRSLSAGVIEWLDRGADYDTIIGFDRSLVSLCSGIVDDGFRSASFRLSVESSFFLCEAGDIPALPVIDQMAVMRLLSVLSAFIPITTPHDFCEDSEFGIYAFEPVCELDQLIEEAGTEDTEKLAAFLEERGDGDYLYLGAEQEALADLMLFRDLFRRDKPPEAWELYQPRTPGEVLETDPERLLELAPMVKTSGLVSQLEAAAHLCRWVIEDRTRLDAQTVEQMYSEAVTEASEGPLLHAARAFVSGNRAEKMLYEQYADHAEMAGEAPSGNIELADFSESTVNAALHVLRCIYAGDAILTESMAWIADPWPQKGNSEELNAA